MGAQGLDDLTEDRFFLLDSSEEANWGTAQEGAVLGFFCRTIRSITFGMKATLNHIGIAIRPTDLEQVQRVYAVLGLKISHQEEVPEQGVRTHFIPFPSEATQSCVELLEPIHEGTVSQFIQKKGPGVHHLSFRVDRGELEPLSLKLKEAGARLIYESPRLGAHKMRINFIHPASTGGVLIEVMEPA